MKTLQRELNQRLRRIYFASALTFVVLLSSSILAYFKMRQTEVSTFLVNHTFEVLQKSQRIELKLNQMVSEVRGFFLTDRTDFELAFSEIVAEIQQVSRELSELVRDNPPQNQKFSSIEEKLDELQLIYRKAITLANSGHKKEGFEFLKTGIGLKKASTIRSELEVFNKIERELLRERLEVNTTTHSLSRLIFTISLSFGMLTFIVAIYLLHKEFSSRFVIQAKLTENAQIQKIMLQSAGFSLIAVDSQNKISLFNEAAEKLLGYRANEVIGRSPEIFHLQKEVEQMAEKLSHRFQTHVTPGIDVFTFRAKRDLIESDQWTYIKKDGSRTQVRLTVTPLKDTKGEIYGFIGIAYDITQQLETEATLIKAREEALAATKAKSEFLANMSHEIRTPMNAIMGMAELLQETSLNDEQKKYVQIFQRAGDSLLTLINDILDLSKIETDRFELEHSAFRLSSVIEKATEIISLKAHQKHLEVAIDIDSDLPDTYFGDSNRLRQILVNILGNAVKFTKKGEILLIVRNLGVKNRKQAIQIEVQDTGIGIGAEQLRGLFERFSQGDTSITREFGGTGLGLNITKKLIHLLGGTIHIESTIGVGTKVKINLSMEVDSDDAVTEQFNLKGLRVLVVDDTRTNRIIFKKIIEGEGAYVKETETGTQALKLIESEAKNGTPFNFILLDCRMPEMDGFTLADKIQSNDKLKGPILLMLTSDSRPGDLLKSKEMGIESFIVKPILRQDLLHAITKTFKKNPLTQLQEPSAQATPLVGMSILLVDDNKENRFVIRSFLKSQSWEIVEAKNGQEAIACFMEKDFDLILMDMQMPVMDGYTATREIRKIEKDRSLSTIPIVALTAYALQEEIKLSFEAGCNDHLSKPVRKKDLFSCIQAYAAKKLPDMDEDLRELYPSYVSRRKDELDSFQRAFEEKDFDTIEVLSHRVKGTAGSYGLKDIESLCAELEKAAQREEQSLVQDLVGKYIEMIKKLP